MKVFILVILLLWTTFAASSDQIVEWGERVLNDELFYSTEADYELHGEDKYNEEYHEYSTFAKNITVNDTTSSYEINKIIVNSYNMEWDSMKISISSDRKSATITAGAYINWMIYDSFLGPVQKIKIEAWRVERINENE